MSLEDQMVDRVLMGHWPDQEPYYRVPGKTGWAPLPNGYRYFNASFPVNDPVLATDCSAFDWTYPAWLVELLLELRIDLLKTRDARYEAMLRARWQDVFHRAVFRMPDGRRFQQTLPGIMKSGWLRTIAENSSGQLLTHGLAWMRSGNDIREFPEFWSMGDDVIMSWEEHRDPEAFESALATTGLAVKFSSRRREFGGYLIEGDIVTPLYAPKHRFMLRHTPPDLVEDVAFAYTVLYACAKEEVRNEFHSKVCPHSRIGPRVAERWCRGEFDWNVG
nr:VP2 [Cat Tien Macrotermes solemo-like virus]